MSDHELVEALAELRGLIAENGALREAWREERRACQEERQAIINICRAHADADTMAARVGYLERSSAWQAWPAVQGHA